MRRPRATRWAVGAGLVALAAGPTAFVAFQPVQVLPRLGLAPGFSLVDHTSSRLTSDDLKGGITLYAFDYGGCSRACAEVDRLLAEVRDRLPEAGTGAIPVRMVQLSLDPEQDAGALPALAAERGADGDVWRLATADTTQLRTVVGSGFETWWVREPDGVISFPRTLVLVDQLGVKRARFRDRIPTADELLGHVRDLAREARATGAAHLAFEAAHLFSCYRSY